MTPKNRISAFYRTELVGRIMRESGRAEVKNLVREAAFRNATGELSSADYLKVRKFADSQLTMVRTPARSNQ
jgi:hypothetical protein